MESTTPIFLLATAGMRLLAPSAQTALLHQTCLFLRHHSHFIVDGPSSAGPCGNSVRIITGEEEGLLGWIAANYLMEGFTAGVHQVHTQTYGFLDMGGASAQIAFEPDAQYRGTGKGLMDVHLRTLGGKDVHHEVFVTTWLGYGSNQARERYVTSLLANTTSTPTSSLSDPCLPRSLHLTERIHPSNTSTSTVDLNVTGTGSFSSCLALTLPTLNKSLPCPPSTHKCMFAGISAPPIQFATSHFVGVSEFWYSSEQVFGLGGEWDYPRFEEQARKFCERDWGELVEEFSAKFERLGEERRRGEMERLKLQCFKAAWVANVLHEGIGMPRVVDLKRAVDDKAHMTPQEVRQKPRFQSADDVNGMSISWTLGKIVVEASKEIEPLRSPGTTSKSKPTLPVEDTSLPIPGNALPYRQRPLEPTIFLVYFATLLLMIILLFRFRRQLRGGFIRLFPASSTSRLEEGLGRSKPSSFFSKPSWMRASKPKLTRPSSIPNGSTSYSSKATPCTNGNSNTPPLRLFPTRSNSFPGLDPTHSKLDAIEAHSSSRSSSPAPSSTSFGDTGLSSGQLTPRSRTASSQFAFNASSNANSLVPPPSRLNGGGYYGQNGSGSGRISRVSSVNSLKRED